MKQQGYKLRFELHAEHSNIRGNTKQNHLHTFTIVLYLKKSDEELELYHDMESIIVEWLNDYQEKCLEKTELFSDGNTTLESIGNRFFKKFSDITIQNGFCLLRLDIYETPIRTYSVTKEIYDNVFNRVHILHVPEDVSDKVILDTSDTEATVYASESPKIKESIVITATKKEKTKQTEMISNVPTTNGHLDIKHVLSILAAVIFVLICAISIMFIISDSGIYPRGSDTLNHLYRARLVYNGIKQGNWYILYDPSWYNGIELMRYWAPIPLYMIALCLWVTGGQLLSSYILFIGVLICLGASGWLLFGIRYKRIAFSAFLGVCWFLLPDNMRVLFAEGNIPRAVVTALIPLLLYCIWQFIDEKRNHFMIPIIILTALIALCHLMIAAMVGISVFIFVCLDSICNRRIKRGIWLLSGMVLSFLIIGIWLIPALKGGFLNMSVAGTSQVMKDFFASGFQSLNALIRYNGEQEVFYYGIGIFIIGILGCIFGIRKNRAGFLTGLFLFFSTTNSLYAFYSRVPFHQFFWMIRFIPVGLAFTFLAMLIWKNIRTRFILILCLILLLDVFPAHIYLYAPKDNRIINAEAEQLRRAESFGIMQAKEYTKQRMALLDLSSYGAYAAYMISAVEPVKNYSFGWAWQGAVTASNIVQLNSAYSEGNFLYLFDRCVLMGNDTVLLRIELLPHKYDDIDKVTEAAKLCGYELKETGMDYLIYSLNEKYDNFGTVTEETACVIGKGAGDLARMFPVLEEKDDIFLDHYTFDELSRYKTIYLTGFEYENQREAERLVKKLSNSNVHIIIDMNNIKENDDKKVKAFLGVTAQSITVVDSFNQLNYKDNIYRTEEFASDYPNWNTVYLNGLDDTDGYIMIDGKKLPFVGSVDQNSNITFLGLNLAYHLQLTSDKNVSTLLEEIIKLKRNELPKREIVPIEINYTGDRIRINSERPNTNTTLAFYDIFKSNQRLSSEWNLLYVDKGETVIDIKYPYFKQGLIISIVGLVVISFYLLLLNKCLTRQRKSDTYEKENF